MDRLDTRNGNVANASEEKSLKGNERGCPLSKPDRTREYEHLKAWEPGNRDLVNGSLRGERGGPESLRPSNDVAGSRKGKSSQAGPKWKKV